MLNRSRIIWSSFRPFDKTLLDNTKPLTAQQKRTTFIVKRKYPPGLYKKSGPPFGEKLKHRHFIYEVLENTRLQKQKPLDIILLDYVKGFGERGDRITVNPTVAYTKLLLPGLAAYASPENIAKFEHIEDKDKQIKHSSVFVERTINILSTLLVSVVMNIETPWTVEKWHVKISLRRAGIHCPEEAITMPEKAITGPNLDIQNKEFYVTVTINQKETVKVRCRIHHFHINPALQLPYDPEFYKFASSPIFPEDKEVLDSLPRHRLAMISTTSTSKNSQVSN